MKKMDEKELIPSLLEKLTKDFSLEKESLPAEQDLTIIRKHLEKKIVEMMAGDYDRFINNLYRIDLNESKVHEVLHSKDKTQIPGKLADLIIERQLIRIKTQILYKQGKL
jgi:hypothetical protein